MRSTFLFALVVVLGSLTRSHAQQAAFIPGDILVMLQPNVDASKLVDDLSMINGERTKLRVVSEVSAPMRTWLLQFDPNSVEQAVVLRAVRNHPDVLLAQNNHPVELRNMPNDTNYGSQWHHENIGSEAAWDLSTGGVTTDGDTIVVCIIEKANLPHDDLIDNAWYNHAEIPNNSIDDDNNGYVDDFRGWDPIDMDDDVYSGGHGTQVAGMIGAKGNNELGITGANWNVKMMVVSNSGANDAGVIASHSYPLVMRRMYNASNGATGAFVVATNASWGVDGGQPEDAPLWCAMYDSLGTAGILNCGATTNQNRNVDVDGDLPTACPSDFMISVTATNMDDLRTFSGYGQTTIDVGAPGANVYTTNINGEYGTTSGTSFASPLTAGVIALLYSAPCASMMALVKDDPSVGALYIRQMLFDGVDQVPELMEETVTGGRINAGNSMQRIMDLCGSCPAPYGLNADSDSETTSTLSWSSVSGTIFDLRYRDLSTSVWTEVLALNAPEFSLSGLSSCTPYEFEVRVYCEADTSVYSAPFVWTSEGCCNAPADLIEVSRTDAQVVLEWSTILAAETFDVRYMASGSTVWTVIPGSTTNMITLAPLTPCTNYTVQVRSLCDGVISDWSTVLSVGTSGCGACVDNVYCSANGDNASDEWIHIVQIGTIDNTTASDDGYGNYTSISTNLQVGAAHPMRLEADWSGFNFSEWFRIWIDLDHDGTFGGVDELVFDTEGASNDPVIDSLRIPISALLGPTRMRIGMRAGNAPTNACSVDFDYGEIEDYCVNITASTGVSESWNSNTFNLYPQPADQELTIQIANGQPSNARMELYDATGALVGTHLLLTDRYTLRTSDMANGLYTFRITAAGRTIGNGRFMVVHGL